MIKQIVAIGFVLIQLSAFFNIALLETASQAALNWHVNS